MSTTIPTRVTHELHDTAKVVGGMTSRSAAQQIEHWARIGREIELGSSVSQKAIAQVLAGRCEYDAVTIDEQAVVRAAWAQDITARLDGLDLAAEFAERGESYVDMDDEGRIVRHHPDGTVIEILDASESVPGS